jgi:light-regulated signal transduction histidine kinase (bacteriophytochrome)
VENPIIPALRDDVTVGLASHTILISKDGREIPIDDSASPIRDNNGHVAGGVLVVRDITVQRLAATSLQTTHQKLKASADDLRRSNEDLSQFAHVASHDLRLPLNTVIQFSQLLEQRYGKTSGDGEGRKLLTFMTDAAQRMRRLVDDLLSYAKTAGEVQYSSAPVDANAVLEAAIANVQDLIKESNAAVSHKPLPSVCIDETHLLQLFQNLIANAIHYRSDAVPQIHISAVEQGVNWLFSCEDNGMGIDAAYHQQIFEAFKRLHGAERPGSGIGLAVCKRIVIRFKGRIWVESQVGRGSTFFFTLPRGS